MTAYLLAVAILGALCSGPFWMAYALKRDQERREWKARADARKLHQGGMTFAGQEAYEQW